MSRRRCTDWGCSNRKGQCPEEVRSQRMCGYAELLRTRGYPELDALLTFHNIGKDTSN